MRRWSYGASSARRQESFRSLLVPAGRGGDWASSRLVTARAGTRSCGHAGARRETRRRAAPGSSPSGPVLPGPSAPPARGQRPPAAGASSPPPRSRSEVAPTRLAQAALRLGQPPRRGRERPRLPSAEGAPAGPRTGRREVGPFRRSRPVGRHDTHRDLKWNIYSAKINPFHVLFLRTI